MDKNIVDSVIEQAGSVENLASKVGVTRQAVYLWRSMGYIPMQRAKKIVEHYPQITLDELASAYEDVANAASS